MARERAAASYEERGRAYLKEHQPDLAMEQFKRAIYNRTVQSRSSIGVAERFA